MQEFIALEYSKNLVRRLKKAQRMRLGQGLNGLRFRVLSSRRQTLPGDWHVEFC